MKRVLTLVMALALGGCVYDPYTGGYYPTAPAYAPAYTAPYAYPYTGYPYAYPYPFYPGFTGGVVIGGGFNNFHNHGVFFPHHGFIGPNRAFIGPNRGVV